MELGEAECFAIVRVVEGDRRDRGTPLFGDVVDTLVVAFDRDASLFVVQAGENRREGVHRVGDRAAESP